MKFISDSTSTDASNAPEIINVSDGATRAEKGESVKTYLNAFAKTETPKFGLAFWSASSVSQESP